LSKKKPRIVPGNGKPDQARLNDKGQEVLDDTPVTLPVRYQRGENITDRVQRMVEETLSRRAAMQGLETVDDANDFYVEGDDYFPSSDHEVDEYAEREFLERQPTGFFKRAAKPAPKSDRANQDETKPAPKPAQSSDEGTGGT